MNSTSRYLIFAALTLLVFNKSVAQKASFETNKGMTIGFGLGAASQSSDIANSKGSGFDFNLGSYLYKKDNAFLSVDWKFRFLAGENKAHDHRINTDDTYSNIRYQFYNYDLELGLTLNRLRERTRIVVTGFAGAGITHGITSTDLLDESGNLYDYSVIDPFAGSKQIYTDLLNLTDGNYEAKLQSKAALMPTAGIHLGYQFTHGFSMGIEHKINFSLTENNSFSGINIDNNIVTGSQKDRNHYTSLVFRWIIRGGSSGPRPQRSYPVATTPAKVYNPPVKERPVTIPDPVVAVSPPLVEIIVPSGSSYSTTGERLDITARVRNVRDKQKIQVALNTRNIPFDYNQLYGNVTSTLVLAEGRNTLVITGSNEAGSNRDDVAIIYNKPVSIDLPVVKFIDPAGPVTVEKNVYSISAQTRNVKQWEDVTVSVNGENFTNFNLSPEGVVKTNIPLREGINRVQVAGKNESGSASDIATITAINAAVQDVKSQVIIKETRPCPAPALRMIEPAQIDIVTEKQSITIRTSVSNIPVREQLSVSLNNRPITNYNFNGNEIAYAASLVSGINTYTISADNSCGNQKITYTIFYKQIEVVVEKPCLKPVIDFLVSAVAGVNATHELKGSATNVKNKSDITVTVNDSPFEGFSFIPTTGEISANFKFNPGSYTVKVTVKNECGTESKIASVSLQQPCVPPQLTMNLTAVTREDATHELKGSATNVKNKSDITVTVNDSPFEGFSFVPTTGEISANFKFNPGSYTVKVTVKNECGSDTYTGTVVIAEEKPCGVRINPGNSSWEFCLITPSGTIIRDTLTNSSFRYSGTASSLYFMPIAGGGDAVVKGAPFTIRPGQYYLFTGSLTVTVSTKNPGSMGQWSVCIVADSEPQSGNGNNRPKSPCQEDEVDDAGKPKKGGKEKDQ